MTSCWFANCRSQAQVRTIGDSGAHPDPEALVLAAFENNPGLFAYFLTLEFHQTYRLKAARWQKRWTSHLLTSFSPVRLTRIEDSSVRPGTKFLGKMNGV
jgi:hypothetical protein